MMFKTHLAFGLLAGLLSLRFLEPKNIIIFLFIACFFAILPDIDEKNSKIGRKLKILSYPLELIFKHRGLFHTIYLPILIFILFLIFGNAIYGFAALIGYVSHLFMDALTINGIRPLHPLISKRVRGFVRTNTFLEFLIFLLIIAMDFYGILNYI